MPLHPSDTNQESVFHHAPLTVANANLVTITDHKTGNIVRIAAGIALV